MRKAFALAALFTYSTTLKALPIGNPAEPELFCEHTILNSNCWDNCGRSWLSSFEIAIGYYGDFVYNRHLQITEDPESTISGVSLFTNAGYFSLSYLDRLEIYGLVGATVLSFASTDFSFIPTLPNSNDILTLNGTTDTSWGVGIRWLAWEYCCWKVGFEGEFFYTCNTIKSIATADTPITYVEDACSKYQEWQIGSAIAYEVPFCYGCSLIPYVGVKWAHVHVDLPYTIGPFTGFSSQENNRDWGWGFGLTLLGANCLSVTAEGRFADEKALFLQLLLSL